jgi:hypothetical protein
VEAKINIHVKMEVKWFWLPLEAPVTTVKRRGIGQINVPRKLSLIPATTVRVTTLEAISVGHAPTAARSALYRVGN